MKLNEQNIAQIKMKDPQLYQFLVDTAKVVNTLNGSSGSGGSITTVISGGASSAQQTTPTAAQVGAEPAGSVNALRAEMLGLASTAGESRNAREYMGSA